MSATKNQVSVTPCITAYLAGPIDSEKLLDSGMNWRKKVTDDLAQLGRILGVDLQTYDPLQEEPSLVGYDFRAWGKKKKEWRRDNRFDLFDKWMGAVIDLDLQRIVESDMVIVCWQNGIDSVGTIDEILYARRELNTPVALVLVGERHQMNPWFDRLTKTLQIPIYYGWDLLYRDIASSWPILWQAKLDTTVIPQFPARLDSDAYRGAMKEATLLRNDHGKTIRKNIIINLGPSGSGKSTQSQFLAHQTDFNIEHIETSALIKEAFDACVESPEATVEFDGVVYSVARQKKIFYDGELNDMGFVVGLIKNKLALLPASCGGVVFSGSPRRLNEAEALMSLLEEFFPHACVTVFEFMLPEETDAALQLMLERARQRKRDEGFDTREMIKKRLSWYKQEAQPVVCYLERLGYKVFRIDAAKPQEEVSATILNCLTV